MFTTSSILLASLFGSTLLSDLKKKPSINGATGWINTTPLTLEELKGKVVLVNFWTYTCINWRRTLPYVREWATKYKKDGLIVIGIHTPEFSFEHESENISRSVAEMDINYPVAIDNDYQIWHAFENAYWPALYLIDEKGHVRYQKFGEGGYEEIEREIQILLSKMPAGTVYTTPNSISGQGFEVSADWKNIKSPETFLGYDRTDGFSSPERAFTNKQVLYSSPAELQLNTWSLSGEWSWLKEGPQLVKGKGAVRFKFHARDLHLVMRATSSDMSVKFRVLIDGKIPGASHGLDIDENGSGVVKEPRMYQLIRQTGNIRERLFEIEFSEPGVDVFDFTFG